MKVVVHNYVPKRARTLDAPKVFKGIYYFPDYSEARSFAKEKGLPTERIIAYERGWAIQRYASGPYYGPNGWDAAMGSGSYHKVVRKSDGKIVYEGTKSDAQKKMKELNDQQGAGSHHLGYSIGKKVGEFFS